MKPPASRPGIKSVATIRTSEFSGEAKQQPANELRRDAIDAVEGEFFGFLPRGLTNRRIRQAQRRDGQDVGAEPDGEAEGQTYRPGDFRGDLRERAVERADRRAKRVVHDRARRRLLVFTEVVARAAR